ncbi:aldehyde dehydrogenase [Sphingosinicella sp. BN140058]|uniref:aldehyde dehydrogenase family protein n=1 Tax=Sphingosinicella sp. BN140058 TaxID=1892855 RepID=UPI001011F5DE|nr:aldehyde dehydrogenase family protein [Sphingosinicella sp. BN140058]QAY77223.1 aldehyde dehydrogenase family protein [Sphingosinicella sp. BN140058]
MNEISRIAAQPAYSEAAQRSLARAPALFIDGAWVASSGDATIAVHDPSTGRQIATIADATDADVDLAVSAARRAFDDGRWTGLSPYQRERAIHQLADLIEQHAAELAELESIDNGKPLASSAGYDIPRSVSTLRYMAGWATRLTGEHLDPANFPSGAVHAYIRREPVGVCAQIVPWNYPLMMAVQKIAPALAAGCTMVLKPAEQTPLTVLRLADLIAQSDIPAGVINIVTGYGESAGDRMVRHPDVNKIGFTGSTHVGKLISRAAVDTLKRVTLELGGKSPVIVLPDVDIGQAANGAARAIFSNAGQVCIAGSRLFAHRSIFDQVIEAVAEDAGQWTVGPSLAAGTRMGPLVSAEQHARVLGYIEAGRQEGASVLVGGDTPGGDGWFVNPTVLVDVKPEMKVVREEIFGPVLAAQRFDDLDEVARAANDTQYGLSASIWTRDLSAMHRLAGKLKSGMVWGNCTSAADSSMPFGGVKQSGLGREGGRVGIEAYTELKTVGIML